MIYIQGFLTATCWNNRTIKVKFAAGKTVHKLFVGGVFVNTLKPMRVSRTPRSALVKDNPVLLTWWTQLPVKSAHEDIMT